MSDTLLEVARDFEDSDGVRWTAVAVETIVAHAKPGAALAFRRADDSSGTLYQTNLTFNGMTAANSAIRSMSEKELERRLKLALTAAYGYRAIPRNIPE